MFDEVDSIWDLKQILRCAKVNNEISKEINTVNCKLLYS